MRTYVPSRHQLRKPAFTLVELLVVIAIIAVLLGLILPAIQSARESARLSLCANNVRQVSAALLMHHDLDRTFPYGGWGHEWIGISKRGAREDQTGGWIFDILPLIERQDLFALASTEKTPASNTILATPIGLFTCPTRRPCRTWAVSPLYPYMQRLRPNGPPLELVARSDYAINAGATLALSFPGPPDVTTGDSPAYSWPRMTSSTGSPTKGFSGVSHLRCGSQLKSITDGASNTYLLGEKFLNPDQYENGESLGDNETMYNGYCTDNHRFTRADLVYLPPARDSSQPLEMSAQLYFWQRSRVGREHVLLRRCGTARRL